MAKKVQVRYIGNGNYLHGHPARDHETDEQTAERELIPSGLYELVEKENKKKESDK